MADSAVAVTAGSGTNIDTRTEGTNGNHRQVVVLGDPTTNAGVAPVDGTNGLAVELKTSIPAGTNAIGKLSANSGVDIGDVDVTSSALPTGASTAANQSTIIGHVDGIETVLGTIDTDTGNIATNTSTVAGAVSGSEMQVDVVAALPAGDNNIGNVDVASALPAGDNNIGNVDVASALPAGDNNIGNVDIASALPAGTNAIGKLAANSGVDIGDVDVTSTPIDNSVNGAGAPTIDSYTSASISASANTANQQLVAAPGASKQIWVYGIQFTVGTGDGSVSFQDEDDTAISGVMPFAQNSGMVVNPSGNYAMPIYKVATNKALEVDTVTCDIKGSIQYAVVSV